jgi:hypothetical protein
MPFFVYWYTGLQHCVIKIAFMQSWWSWETYASRTVTPTGRFAGCSILPLRVAQPDRKPDSVAFLAYVRPIFSHISRVLYWHSIKSVVLPPRKICSFLWSVKEYLKLKYQEYTVSPVSAVRSKWADRPFNWHQVEGAPATYPPRTWRQVSHGAAEYQLGAPHPATPHRHPLHQTQTHGSHQEGNWDWALSQK